MNARPRLDRPVAKLHSRAIRIRRGVGELLPGALRAPLALGLVVAVLFWLYFSMLGSIQPVSPGREMRLDEFRRLLNDGQVSQVVLHDHDARMEIDTVRGTTGWAAYPRSDAATADLIDQINAQGTRLLIDQQSDKARARFLVQFLLPLVILAGLFGLVFMVVMRANAAGGEFTSFSQIRKKKAMGRQVTFDDVAAADEAIVELREVVEFLREPSKWLAVGARAPKGVLLTGPPGTGKTLLARAVAGEAGTNFYSMSGSEFVESLVGVGAGRVRDLFRQARQNAPAIIFIDEIDAAGRQRGAGMGQGNDEREQTLNQLLVEMDGFAASSGIVVLGATNRPDILDPALLRPGRFDRQVVVDAPDVHGRVDLLHLYTKGRQLDAEVDLVRIARQVPGFTGAEIANLVNEASLLAVRDNRSTISAADLEAAVDRVVAGTERRSHVLSPAERHRIAIHEVGHAIVAAAIGVEAGVQKLSIVPRGRTLGHVTTYQIADRLVLSRAELWNRIVTHMGGIAAEELVFGETSTAGEGDLRDATKLARTMVGTLGMNPWIGRVAVMPREGEVFLGRDLGKAQDVSAATLEIVDVEVRALMDDAEGEAARILSRNQPLMDELVEKLLESETLSGPSLDEVLTRVRAAGGSTAPKVNASRTVAKRKARTARSIA